MWMEKYTFRAGECSRVLSVYVCKSKTYALTSVPLTTHTLTHTNGASVTQWASVLYPIEIATTNSQVRFIHLNRSFKMALKAQVGQSRCLFFYLLSSEIVAFQTKISLQNWKFSKLPKSNRTINEMRGDKLCVTVVLHRVCTCVCSVNFRTLLTVQNKKWW